MSQLAIAVAVLLVLLGALLATAETVLLRLSLVRALRLDEDGEKGAAALLWLVEHRSRSHNAVLVLSVLSRIAAASLVTAVAVKALGGVVGVAVGAGATLLVSLLVGEIVPRTWTLRYLERAGLGVARPLALLVRLTAPVASALVDVGRAVAGTRADVSGPYPDDDELRQLLEAAEDDDDPLEADEREMIRNVFELGDTVVREIMVPRPDMVTVDEEATLRTLVNAILKHGYSRIPVHRESRDQIVGVVYAKDVLRLLAMNPGAGDWSSLLRTPTYVPESKRVDDLLRELQEQTVHLAIVVDEYGAVSGLVTIEDILEEIVGEIVDEHDHEPPMVVTLDDGSLRVDGRVPVDDLNQILRVELPNEDWDSVGGLVFNTLGHVPAVGERVELAGVVITVERVQGRRIAQVVVVPPAESDDGADAQASA